MGGPTLKAASEVESMKSGTQQTCVDCAGREGEEDSNWNSCLWRLGGLHNDALFIVSITI